MPDDKNATPQIAMSDAPAGPAMAPNRRVLRSNQTDENSRIFAVRFSSFYQEVTRLQRALFDGDIDLFIVAAAIAVGAIEGRMRDPAFRGSFASLKSVVGEDLQRGCNALSIAQATGLPRETVRRRINRLIDMGIVARLSAGNYVLRPGVVQTSAYENLFRRLSDELLRLVNDCVEEQVYIVGKTTSPHDPETDGD
jgi:hypothetical protein